jgi:hypothetical protein
MLRMGHWHGQHPNRVQRSRACITQLTTLPTALASRDLPGIAQLAPVVQQPIALGPAQYKTQVGLERLEQPLARRKAAILDMADLPPPLVAAACQQLSLNHTPVTGELATTTPPLHRRYARPTLRRWLEEARPNTGKPARFT